MADERKITDCEHFLAGNCSFGDRCFYRHPMKLHQPMVLCKFWQSYSCTNYYCPYLHPAVLPTIPQYVPHIPHRKEQLPREVRGDREAVKSAVVCAYYMSGRCSKPECPFLHSLPDAVSSRHPQSSSDTQSKTDAANVLNKYSFKHNIEETAAMTTERKLRELDRKLENYQSIGATSILGKNSAKGGLENNESVKKMKVNKIEGGADSNDIDKIDKTITSDFLSLS